MGSVVVLGWLAWHGLHVSTNSFVLSFMFGKLHVCHNKARVLSGPDGPRELGEWPPSAALFVLPGVGP